MKKILLMATAGLLAFASCQEKAGYTIKGTIEGVAEGDTVSVSYTHLTLPTN